MENEPSLNQESQLELFKQEMLETLYHLRNDYKNEIPPPHDIKRSTDPDQKWKVRKGWFATIKIALARIKNKITLSPELQEEMIHFNQRRIGDINGLTTPEDIEAGDRIIDKVIAELEK